MKYCGNTRTTLALHSLTLAVKLVCSGLLLTTTLALPITFSNPATAQESPATTRLQFDIVKGDLAQGLNQFASRAGIYLSVNSSITQGKTTAGLRGQFTVEEGLQRLLQGSGLQYRFQDAKTVTITATGDGPVALPAVKVSGAALGSATEDSNSYTTQSAGVGGKMDESLREIPRSVSVITRQQLDDQRTLSFYEVMNQMPGVTTTYGGGNDQEVSFHSRGFRLDNVTADGMSISAAGLAGGNTRGGGNNSGMAKYDSVQLLRGPNGLFAGNGQPSGTVNLVRKRPTDSLQIKTALSAGSWGNYAGEVDLSSPLTSDGRLRGRVVAARQDADHFYDSDGNRKTTLYGIVDFKLADSTVLSVGGSRDTQHGAPDQPPGLPRYTNGATLDISRRAGYPGWAVRNYDVDNIFLTLEHRFNEQWRLKTGASDTRTRKGVNEIPVYSGAVDPQTNIGLGSYATLADWNRRVKTFDFNLIGELNLWQRQQQLVFGADLNDSSQYSLIGGVPANDPVRNQPIDWSQFNSETALKRWSNTPAWDNDTRHKQQGLYAYGKFQLYGPLSLTLGGRYAVFDGYSTGLNAYPAEGEPCPSWATTCGTAVSLNNMSSDNIFIPYYALTYDISTIWSAYVSLSRSYENQSNYYDRNHNPLDPTEGNSWELGLKGEFFEGRLNSNITFYRSKRDNYAVSVGGDETFNQIGKSCCYAGNGEFLAQGVEIDLSGALTANWQINAGYTYDDNKTEYGSNDGIRYASYTPRHILRLWSSYQLQGVFTGLRLGGGVQAQSDFFRSGTVRTWNPTGGRDGAGAFDGPNVPYQFNEPGRALWNFFAEYRLNDNWSAALNVNNAFDKRYYQSVGTTTGGNYYGAPGNWTLTLRSTF